MTTAAPPGERLGDLLVQDGLLTTQQLRQALAEQRSSGHRLGYVVVKLGLVDEVDVTKALARQLRMPAVDLSRFEPDVRVLRLIPAEVARKHLVLPLRREGRTLTVAMADPTDLGLLQDLKFITRYDAHPVIAGEFTLRGLIEKHYDAGDQQQLQDLLRSMEGAADEDVELVEDQEEEAVTQAQINDAPVVKLINGILTEAVRQGASDIHIEPFEHELRVRYRIDGALQEIMKPPMRLKAALISRVKILASLNIAERRVPQDGRIKLKLLHRVIDFRVSTLPVLFGEKVVLRILDKGNLTLDLTTFGFEPKAQQDLLRAIHNPYGMVLVTGPTGSGKTTTLYSALQRINTPDTNIMTAEDPVEYNLPGINQVQVKPEIGLTFATALRAFLRQDPNIIMIGEVRDLETGSIAIKAALTGHLVLSTLHTNDAPSTVTRLLDMGIEPFNVASAVNLVVAQRLVRRICADCRAPATYTRDQLATLGPDAGQLPLMRGQGCDSCGGSGYRGRQGLYEVMAMSPEIRRLVLRGSAADELRAQAIREGMLTLRMDGITKIARGITTLEEVVKETAG
jgi:type IV pilus assembly protein PilB